MGHMSEQAATDRKIRALAEHLRYPLSLPIHGPSGPIDLDMAKFASHRHRVGSLLYRAGQQAPSIDITSDVQQWLRAAHQDNVYLQLKQKTVVKNLQTLLLSHAIPCFFVKGGQLGAQLYDDPHVRWAKDIDVLVSSKHTSDALTVLTQAGYRFKEGSQTLRPKRDRWRLWANKDITFLDPKFGQIIELHERLIHIEPDGFTQRVIGYDGGGDAPPISHASYVLYLILHGALTYFRRLKWLVDLSSLLRRVPPYQKTEVFELAKQFHCLQALIASLQFTEDYFPDTLDDDWKALIAANERPSQTDVLRQRFARGLCGGLAGNAMMASPLRHFPIPERVIFERAPLSYSQILWRKTIGVMTRR